MNDTISRAVARQIYNRLGHDLDRAVRYEYHAKQLGLRLLSATAGQRILHIGVGTGGEQAVLQSSVSPRGLVVGYDLARGMLELTRQRVATPLCEGDALRLPFAEHCFAALFCAYVLDLIPTSELPLVLAEFQRVVRPGGRIVLLTLTEGVDLRSRVFVAVWKLAYRFDPQRFGGCRPLALSTLLTQAGLSTERHVVVQRGFPSEVLVGTKS